MNRREFIASLSALGVAAPLIPSALHAEEAPAEKKAGAPSLFAFPVYVQFTSPDTADVRWRTTEPTTGFVYWTQDESKAQSPDRTKAFTSLDGMIAANRCDHCITLRGIDPLKPLIVEAVSEPLPTFAPYKIVRGKAQSGGVLTLRPRLQAGNSLTMAIFNDLHGHVDLVPKLLAVKEVEQAKPAIAIFNGDCQDDCISIPAAEKRFLRALPPLIAGNVTPLVLRGNHEYRGAMARRIREVLSPLACGRFYGAFTLGSVRFVFIDSGEDKLDETPVYGGLLDTDAYVSEQAEWLKKEVASSAWKDAPWRVAVMHIPPYANLPREDKWYGPTRLREKIEPVLFGSGLDLLIAGHTHQYSYVPEGSRGQTYPTLVGGGPSDKIATVFLLQADDKHLKVQGYKVDGTALDTVAKSK